MLFIRVSYTIYLDRIKIIDSVCEMMINFSNGTFTFDERPTNYVVT